MAFLPGIFGNGNKQQASQQQSQQQQAPQNQQQQQNSQQQAPQQNQNGSAGGVGNQMQQNANSQMNPSNPLDPFMNLMTPSKEVQQQKQQKQQQNSQGLFGDNFTPDNIQKAVGGVNFAQNLDPAKVTAALGGDTAAFMEVLNSAVQSGVSASVQMSHGMVERGVQTGQERFAGDLDSRFRDFTLRSQNADNPALKHPVGKALLSTVAKQIADANPRMPADEVHRQAQSMFTEFSKMLTAPSAEEAAAQKGKGEMDWMNFVDDTHSQQ